MARRSSKTTPSRTTSKKFPPKEAGIPEVSDDYISLGYVTQAHGLRGEFRVHLHNPNGETLWVIERVYLLSPQHKTFEAYTIRELREHSKGCLMSLKECRDRNQAEALRRSEIFVHEEDLPGLEEDEYYLYELVGLPVFSTEGHELGSVDRLMPNQANPLLVVLYEGREILVPLVTALVPEVDLEAGRIIVDAIPGLFWDEESPSPPASKVSSVPSFSSEDPTS